MIESLGEGLHGVRLGGAVVRPNHADAPGCALGNEDVAIRCRADQARILQSLREHLDGESGRCLQLEPGRLGRDVGRIVRGIGGVRGREIGHREVTADAGSVGAIVTESRLAIQHSRSRGRNLRHVRRSRLRRRRLPLRGSSEAREVVDEVFALRRIRNGEHHERAGDGGAWSGEEVIERLAVPRDPRLLECGGVLEARNRASLSPHEPLQRGPLPSRTARRVAHSAPLEEKSFARARSLGLALAGGEEDKRSAER